MGDLRRLPGPRGRLSLLLPCGRPYRLRNTLPPGRARDEGEEMRVARLQELEEIAAKLLATARELPSGQDRHNALREIGRFRVRISALQAFDLRRANEGLWAKGKR